VSGKPSVTPVREELPTIQELADSAYAAVLNHVFIGRRADWFGVTGRKAYRLLWSSPSIAFLRGRDRRGCESAAPQEISETAIGS
jgi:hypothetical protein